MAGAKSLEICSTYAGDHETSVEETSLVRTSTVPPIMGDSSQLESQSIPRVVSTCLAI